MQQHYGPMHPPQPHGVSGGVRAGASAGTFDPAQLYGHRHHGPRDHGGRRGPPPLPANLVALVRNVLLSARDPIDGHIQWVPLEHFQTLFRRHRGGDNFRFDTLHRYGVRCEEDFFNRCPRDAVAIRQVYGRMQVMGVPDQ